MKILYTYLVLLFLICLSSDNLIQLLFGWGIGVYLISLVICPENLKGTLIKNDYGTTAILFLLSVALVQLSTGYCFNYFFPSTPTTPNIPTYLETLNAIEKILNFSTYPNSKVLYTGTFEPLKFLEQFEIVEAYLQHHGTNLNLEIEMQSERERLLSRILSSREKFAIDRFHIYYVLSKEPEAGLHYFAENRDMLVSTLETLHKLVAKGYFESPYAPLKKF